MTEKETLKAVHDDDLVAFLTKLGLYNKFINGKFKCAFCGDVITWDNLHSLFPDSGQVKWCCVRSECQEQFLVRVQELRGR